MTDAAVPEIDPRLLEILVCPVTHGSLTYDRDAQELISRQAKLAYPIRDGVPIMLAEEARSLEVDGSIEPSSTPATDVDLPDGG